MNQQKNIRVIFTDKADVMFENILRKYGVEESQEEIFNKLSTNKLPKTIMVGRIIEAFVGEIITEEDFDKSLKKVLKLDQVTTGKLAREIIKNLVPLLVTAPEEKFNDPAFREEISKKVFGEEKQEEVKEKFPLGAKKIEVKDVEKSAEELEKSREAAAGAAKESAFIKAKEEREKQHQEQLKAQPEQPKGQADRYREPIE